MAINRGDSVSAGSLYSTLMWGNTDYWEDEASNDDIDSYIDSHTNDSYRVFSFHHIGHFKNSGVGDLGNRLWGFGWLNSTKNYGWVFLVSFGGMIYGKRSGATKFSFTKLAT